MPATCVRLLAAAAAIWAGAGCTTLGDDLAPRLPDAAMVDALVIEPDAGPDAGDAGPDAADAGAAADAGPDAAADGGAPDATSIDAPAAAQQW